MYSFNWELSYRIWHFLILPLLRLFLLFRTSIAVLAITLSARLSLWSRIFWWEESLSFGEIWGLNRDICIKLVPNTWLASWVHIPLHMIKVMLSNFYLLPCYDCPVDSIHETVLIVLETEGDQGFINFLRLNRIQIHFTRDRAHSIGAILFEILFTLRIVQVFFAIAELFHCLLHARGI